MTECKVQKNKASCPCSYPSCSRKGICCECIAYHRRSGELPGCCFPPDVEKTFDRSIETFVETVRRRGPWW
ncbi:MAG: DUF6485 family protein [Candidatus Latescibacter sp.]|nr:DUF6485 family protein [Candidatus Latescibacter sp.]